MDSNNFSLAPEIPERLVCANLSMESVSDVFRLPEALQPYHISLVVIYMLYLLVGLPWNLLVMGIIVKQRLYQQPTILLLLNLVVTDCLILLTLAVKVITGIAGEFVLGDSDHVRCEVCRTELSFRNTVQVSAILTVAVIAFDRFFFIHKPFRYEKLIGVKSALIMVAVIWLFSVLYALFNYGVLGNIFLDKLLQCAWDLTDHPYFHVNSLLVIILPYIFLVVCNVWVMAIVFRNIRSIYNVEKSSSKFFERRVSIQVLKQRMKETRSKKQLHLMRVFGGLIAANTLSSLPTAILAIFSFFPELVPLEYIVLSIVLFNLQAVIHPILESTLISEIRIPMLKLLSCACCWKRQREAHFNSERRGSYAATCCCRCCHGDNEPFCCDIFKLVNARMSITTPLPVMTVTTPLPVMTVTTPPKGVTTPKALSMLSGSSIDTTTQHTSL